MSNRDISFEDLVQFILENSDKVFINAYRTAFKKNDHIPEMVRELVIQEGDSGREDIILKHWRFMQNEIGNLELLYYRTKSAFEEEKQVDEQPQ